MYLISAPAVTHSAVRAILVPSLSNLAELAETPYVPAAGLTSGTATVSVSASVNENDTATLTLSGRAPPVFFSGR